MKKLLLSFAVMAFAVTAFAQQSNKYYATTGLFNTDVDNFIDVNGWSTVKPEHFFGYLGYNNGIDYGMSHQFKKGYGAFYFNGLLSSFTLSSFDTNMKEAGTIKTSGTTTDEAGRFNTAFLFGKGDLAFKADMEVQIFNDSVYAKSESITTSESGKDHFTINPVFSVGLNNKKFKKWSADYSFGTGYYGNINKDYSGSAMTDNSKHSIGLFGKAILEKESETLNKELDITAATNITFAPSTFVKTNIYETKQHGDTDFSLTVNPDYILTYKLTDKATLKGSVGGIVGFGVDGSRKYTETNGVKTYDLSNTTVTSFNFIPTAKAGISYSPAFKKIKFPVDLNAGASIDIPTSTIAFSKTETYGGEPGEVTSTTNGKIFKFESVSGYLTLNAGVTAKPAKNITVDVYTNLLSHIFGTDLNTDFAEGNGTNFWNNVNKALVHNIYVLVSVKL